MRLCDLSEMARPDETIQSLTFYHGTPSAEKARSIRKNGLSSPHLQQGRGHLAPVAGRVYLTPSLRYAVIYALRGDFIGHEIPAQRRGNDRYGYVFVIEGRDIIEDIQPDEDSVGEALMYADDILHRDRRGRRYYGGNSIYQGLDKDRWFAKTFYAMAKSCMTERQFRNAVEGEVSYQAAGGKRCLKKMPEWMKVEFIKMGAHLGHLGGIHPSHCWRILRSRSKDLHGDASNFFEVAEQVY